MSLKDPKKPNLLPDQPNHIKDPDPDPGLPTIQKATTPLAQTEESLRLQRIHDKINLYVKTHPTEVTAAVALLLPGILGPAIVAASALASDGVYALSYIHKYHGIWYCTV